MSQPAATRSQTRSRTAPVAPRRVSGPARGRAVPAVAVPAGARGRGATGVFERIRALPENRVVDRLLRSRASIWMIGVMLGGIVAMQVSLLRLNTGISRAVATQTTLERQNAAFESDIAELTSGDRVRSAAVKEHMVDPQAGDTVYLHARPGVDAPRAARRMKPPSAAARGIMANYGRVPGALAGAAGALAAAGAVTQVGTTAAGAAATTAGAVTPAATAGAAAATAQPTVTATATVAPVQTPAPTVAPVQAAAGTGAPAPQG